MKSKNLRFFGPENHKSEICEPKNYIFGNQDDFLMKRGNIRAQISLEFLIVVGFAFLMTIPLIILFYQQSESLNTDITASQMDKVASEIRDAADEVYYLGSPSKKTVALYFPEGIQSISFTNNKMIFLVDAPGDDYQLVKWTAANLTGSIQTHKGIHHVTAESFDSYVQITDS